ncbi:MAG: type II secretion system F family protein [Candidatus Zixiibacteriota bacterium]
MATTYKYTGRTPAGKPVKGDFQAESRERALELLSERDMIITSLKESTPRRRNRLNSFLRPDYSQELVLFARHLATYHRSGIPMLKALSLIKVGDPRKRFQQVMREVRRKVTEGKPLSLAMKDYPEVFGDVFVNSVEAGEASGQLSTILDDTAEALEQELELRRQIRSSLRYPIIVVIAIVTAVAVVVTVVIPKFAVFYAKFDADLPGPTKAILWLSDFVITQWHLTIAIAGTLVYAFRRYVRSKSGKRQWDRALLALPVFGQLMIKASVARFGLLFRILFKSGIPLVKSLSILEASMTNVHLREEIVSMRESFETGRELEFDPGGKTLFPEMSLNMIKSGLESGSLDLMLEEIGSHYSREVRRTSRNLAALIEPLMTVVIGGVILILALSIFLPMWNLIHVFRQ